MNYLSIKNKFIIEIHYETLQGVFATLVLSDDLLYHNSTKDVPINLFYVKHDNLLRQLCLHLILAVYRQHWTLVPIRDVFHQNVSKLL